MQNDIRDVQKVAEIKIWNNYFIYIVALLVAVRGITKLQICVRIEETAMGYGSERAWNYVHSFPRFWVIGTTISLSVAAR